MRSVRAIAGTPPTASKKRTRPSKVWFRSIEVVNHHKRARDHDKIAPKHHSSPRPQRRPQSRQSVQSNWHSSPGAVSIGTDTIAARRNRGPRRSRKNRATVG